MARASETENRRIVVTGVGAVSPLGVGARATVERWEEGESGIEHGLAGFGGHNAALCLRSA